MKNSMLPSLRVIAVAAMLAVPTAWANRELEALERYRSDSLSIVSISAVGCDGTRTARIRDPENYMHNAHVGGYVGDAYGKIVDITDREVRFVELHQSASGEWTEVPKSLRLRDGLSAVESVKPGVEESACRP